MSVERFLGASSKRLETAEKSLALVAENLSSIMRVGLCYEVQFIQGKR